jgi:hypothetical protein
MTTAITTTATAIIMFLFLSGPSNMAIAPSLSEVLPGSLFSVSLLYAKSGHCEIEMRPQKAVTEFRRHCVPWQRTVARRRGRNGRVDAMELGGLDVPLAVLVLGA